MNWRLSMLIALFLPFLSYAQTTVPSIPHSCQLDHQTAAAIKQKLMDNRNSFTKQQIKDLTTNRAITYIPVVIHNVSNTSGEGETPVVDILNFMCGLNGIYADQEVQFFLYGPIRNRTSNNIDGNGFAFSSQVEMATNKVTNALNLYIGRSTNDQRASYYNSAGDFVFLLQQMLSAGAKTEAHEIGHFFTLPHTFYGWEGLTAETSYPNQNVPATINNNGRNFRPERVARTGSGANCQTEADGFCDTPADYYSDRESCPYNPTMKDPTGASLDPDESNLMSYAFDACVSTFTPEQEAAIAMDIAQRSWVSQTPPNTNIVTGTPLAVNPADGQALGPISNPTVRLDWSDVTDATWYYLEVYGTRIPGLNLPNTTDIVYQGMVYTGNSHFDLPTTDLIAGKYYAWRIRAMNEASTCAGFSSYYKFEASTATAIEDLPLAQQLSLKINNNPITTSYIPMTIYSSEELMGSVRLYSMDGREVLSMTKQNLAQGESIVQLPAGELTNGVYVAVLNTERGTIQQRLVIQR